MNVTPETARTIENLVLNPSASIVYCELPLGSIYFSDELPENLLPGRVADYLQVMRILGLRVNLWNGLALSAEDQAFWQDAQHRFPNWPVFQRMTLTPEQRRAHEGVLEDLDTALRHLDDDGT